MKIVTNKKKLLWVLLLVGCGQACPAIDLREIAFAGSVSVWYEVNKQVKIVQNESLLNSFLPSRFFLSVTHFFSKSSH